MIRVSGGDWANHLRQLIAVLPLVLLTHTVRANEEPPDLLNFAMRYHHEKDEATHTGLATSQQKKLKIIPSAPTQACSRTINDLLLNLKKRDLHLKEQRRTLHEQETQLTQLRQAINTAGAREKKSTIDHADKIISADFSTVWQQVKKIRNLLSRSQPSDLEHVQLFRTSPPLGCNQSHQAQRLDELQRENGLLKDSIVQKDDALEALRQEKQAAVTNLTALRDQTGLSRQTQEEQLQEKSTLEKVIAELNSRLGELTRENGTLKDSIVQKDDERDKLQKHSKEVSSRLLKQDLELTSLRNQITELRDRTPLLAKPDNLKGAEERQDYAAGSALGRDIISMLEERKVWGLETDRQFVLAGVIDAFSGHYQLQQDELTKALADSEILATKARNKLSTLQKKNAEPFITNFKEQKGVKYSETGFWYRIDYAGDSQITDDTIIDVVVKESLTDGTVVHDMALDNKVLSQPMKSFPPIFREALGYLRNHGSLTMVVPPELAYGKNGYPPTVPPDATMVYELRIDNNRIK